MDFFTSMKISSSGLNVQRKRMEAIASNLANAETTRTPEGGPYRRQDIVITAMPVQDNFNTMLKSELGESLGSSINPYLVCVILIIKPFTLASFAKRKFTVGSITLH
jgi:flagellar basal body rod protein FlgC